MNYDLKIYEKLFNSSIKIRDIQIRYENPLHIHFALGGKQQGVFSYKNIIYHQQQMSQGELEQGEFQQNEDDNEGESSQYIKTTKAGRKKLCDVCTKSLAKYTCPGCMTKSCSLTCVNKHKTNDDCSGKVNPTQYLQKHKIDEGVVRKDYQYMKNMLDQTDKVKKTLTGVTAPVQQPKRFYFLRKQANAEYNTKVHQAPAMIERHRQNISFYYMKTKTIYWVIQILYFKGNKKYTKHLLQPQPDSKIIQEILPTNFLCQELLLKEINTQKPQQFDVFIQNREMSNSNNEKSQQKIQERRIFQLNKETKLCDALRNLNVYQFPTLILVHKSLKKSFMKWKKIN